MSFALGMLGILLSLPAWFFFLRACGKLYRHVRQGRPEQGRNTQPLRRLLRTGKEIFFHTRMMAKPAVAIAHWFVMMGFLVGVVVWFEAYIQTFNPAGGWPLLSALKLYHFLEEVLALGTTVGIVFLIVVRLHAGVRARFSRFYGSNAKAAYFVEAIVLVEALGMLAVKAGKIATFGHSSPCADFFTRHLAGVLPASATLVSVLALIKLLTGMLWLVVVAYHLNWGVAWHRILAFFNIYFARPQRLGALAPMRDNEGAPITLDSFEHLPENTPLGLGTAAEATWKTLLDVTSCTECGRCQEQCPAWHTDKPLSPKLLVTDLRDAALSADLSVDNSHDGVNVLALVGSGAPISEDVLWSCTNCGACVEQCPVDIEHIDHVANLRRFQVLTESAFPSELGGMFKNLEVKGNPWGRNNSERVSWVEQARAEGIEVPVIGDDVTDFSDTEYLLWVGCAGAFDDAGRRTTRAVVDLLHTAGVKFAVLATGETCTGDPARRAGNEFLFQQLAMENIDTLNSAFAGVPAGQRKIITSCPHCFNTIRNEYPDFDGHFDVFHHTQLLNRLVRDGLLTPVPRSPENRRPVTYHDPCFLGRHNKVYDPPRELIESATGGSLTEMPRNRDEGFCCGAGGARMFMEEKIGTRINEVRAAEAAATGATEVVVGCPFCNTMMTGGLKALETEQAPAVKDVAQMLRAAVADDTGALPTPRPKAFLELPIRSARPKAEPPTPKKEVAQPPQTTPTAPAAPSIPPVGTPSAPPQGVSPVPAPGSGTPVPTPGPTAPTPVPGAPAVPTPGATPAVPAPGGSAIPVPGAPVLAPQPPTPGASSAVPVPSGGAPTPTNAPAPGGSVPTPGASSPVPTPGLTPVTPPAPGGTPVPAPGGNTPTPASAVPVPGSPVPAPAPHVPQPPGQGPVAPGATTPTPGGVPTVPTPGSAQVTPREPGGTPVPAPGGTSATPPAPPTPMASEPAIPAPGAAAPQATATPPAPGALTPPPTGAVPAPTASIPTPAPKSAVPAPGGNTPPPRSAVPAPGGPVPTPIAPSPAAGVPSPLPAPPGGPVAPPGSTPAGAPGAPGASTPTPPGGVTPPLTPPRKKEDNEEDQGKP